MKVWERPQLVVLERATSAEMVLDGCKTGSKTGPNSTNNACQKDSTCAYGCWRYNEAS